MSSPLRPQIGWLADVDNVPLFLKGPGLKAHTLIVGQSGSGKSFMLGRLIEEIMIASEASLLILDPNSDFVKFSEIDDSVWGRMPQAAFLPDDSLFAFKKSWAKQSFGILSMREADDLALKHRRARVERPALEWPSDTLSVAGILGFDTMTHSDDIQAIANAQEKKPTTLAAFVEAAAGTRACKRVYTRAFEADCLPIWSTEDYGPTVSTAVNRLFSTDSRALCVDLASLEDRDARLLIVREALQALWAGSRKTWFEALGKKAAEDLRRPVFIVVDEAHNLAPASPAVGGPTTIVTDLLVRIATEGRKYGLYLILVTQRPSRLDETLRTQCDNLCLMKMNDRHDLQLIEQSFGFIPEGWAKRATEFKQGDVLFGGSLVEKPVYARTSPRRTVEGGRNIRDGAWLPYLR